MTGKIATGLILAALLVYGLIEGYPLLAGPSVTLESPKNGESFTAGVALISGKVKRATSLTLNGTSLLPDEKGSFLSTLAFPKGTSILTLVAKDRFGRTSVITRSIYVPD